MKTLFVAFAATLAVASPAFAQDAPASSQLYTDCDPASRQITTSEACDQWDQAPNYDESRGDFSGDSDSPLSLTDDDWSD